MLKIRNIGMVFVFAVGLCGCGGTNEADVPDETAATPAAPTPDELKSATFSSLEASEGPIALTGGVWEGAPYVAGAASRPRVMLVDSFYLTGDLDADGIDEAAVLLSESTGGSGERLYLAAVDADLKSPSAALIGDRVKVRGGKIMNGVIVLNLLRAGPQDAMCCPGELATQRWRLAEAGLEPVGEAEIEGRLSVAVLEGQPWVLTHWALDEKAPAKPRATLQVEGDRVSGASGCNNYSTTIADGSSPGDLSVGLVISTRKACPQPTMDVEMRYLRQLQTVTQYTFLSGRLALTYELDTGGIAVMLFERAE